MCKAIDIPFVQLYRGPSFVTSVKGTASRWAKGEQGQYVAQNAFLASLQKGKPGTRPTSPARPTEVLISIFLSATTTSCFLRRSSDRDILKSLFMRVIWYKRWDSSVSRDSRENSVKYSFYQVFFFNAIYRYNLSNVNEAHLAYIKLISILQFNRPYYYLIIFFKIIGFIKDSLWNWRHFTNLSKIILKIYIWAKRCGTYTIYNSATCNDIEMSAMGEHTIVSDRAVSCPIEGGSRS